MKEVTTLIVNEVSVKCPNCDEIIDGWMVDPRGETDTCDYCEKEYKIHKDADCVLN